MSMQMKKNTQENQTSWKEKINFGLVCKQKNEERTLSKNINDEIIKDVDLVTVFFRDSHSAPNVTISKIKNQKLS